MAESNNPNCEETFATFRVLGTAVNRDRIAERLGLEGPALLRLQLAPEDVFWISSKGYVVSTDLEEHLVHLLELLEPLASNLDLLRREGEFQFEFFCYWVSATGQGGPVLSWSTLARMAQLHIDLDFDIYMSEELFSDS